MPGFPRFAITVALLGLLAAACAPAAPAAAPTQTAPPPTSLPATAIPPTPAPPTPTPAPLIGRAPVEKVTVTVQAGPAAQVEVLAAGELPDACTQIGEAVQSREGAVFQVSLMTVRAADMVCAQMLQPYAFGLSLDAPDLEPGTYTVSVNGVSAEFTVPEPQPDALVSTTIIQDYEADPAAADAKYKDQIFVIQGRITNINDVFGTQALLLRDSEAETGLQCYLSDNADAARVAVGDTVVIEGRVRGGDLGFFMVVDDCRVLSP
jgi:hypothetical protein